MSRRQALHALASALALVACVNEMDPARVSAARAAETARRFPDVVAEAARARAALPTCSDDPPPERPSPPGSDSPVERARRVEGTYDTSSMSIDATENLCPVMNPCCVLISPQPRIRLDSGSPVVPNDSPFEPPWRGRVPIPMKGPARALFRHGRGQEPMSHCDLEAWLKGFGTPRLRLTWYPFVPRRRALEVVELCEVRAAKPAP